MCLRTGLLEGTQDGSVGNCKSSSTHLPACMGLPVCPASGLPNCVNVLYEMAYVGVCSLLASDVCSKACV